MYHIMSCILENDWSRFMVMYELTRLFKQDLIVSRLFSHHQRIAPHSEYNYECSTPKCRHYFVSFIARMDLCLSSLYLSSYRLFWLHIHSCFFGELLISFYSIARVNKTYQTRIGYIWPFFGSPKHRFLPHIESVTSNWLLK